jgi:hypothetical protein
MTENDPGKLADELDQQADELGGENAALKENIDETRQDWQRKREDASVPGAVPPDGDGDSDRDEANEANGSPAAESPREESGGQDDDAEDPRHNEGSA